MEGHVLIVSRRHVTAMADLTVLESHELSDICERVRNVLEACYVNCIFFEHGIRSSGSGGCGIDHAHVHAVPVTGAGVMNILERKFNRHRVARFSDILDLLSKETSYVYFESNEGERQVFETPFIPSQYMRRLVCESLGKQNWDWRTAGFEPDLIATVQRLSAEFCTSVAFSGK